MSVLDIALNMGVAAVTVAVMLCAWRLCTCCRRC